MKIWLLLAVSFALGCQREGTEVAATSESAMPEPAHVAPFSPTFEWRFTGDRWAWQKGEVAPTSVKTLAGLPGDAAAVVSASDVCALGTWQGSGLFALTVEIDSEVVQAEEFARCLRDVGAHYVGITSVRYRDAARLQSQVPGLIRSLDAKSLRGLAFDQPWVLPAWSHLASLEQLIVGEGGSLGEDWQNGLQSLPRLEVFAVHAVAKETLYFAGTPALRHVRVATAQSVEATFLSKSPHVERLALSCTRCDGELTFLGNVPQLKSLRFDTAGRKGQLQLPVLPNLSMLSLHAYGADYSQLAAQPSLTELTVSGIPQKGWGKAVAALPLQRLSLRLMEAPDEEFAELAKSQTLTELRYDKQLTKPQAKALADAGRIEVLRLGILGSRAELVRPYVTALPLRIFECRRCTPGAKWTEDLAAIQSLTTVKMVSPPLGLFETRPDLQFVEIPRWDATREADFR